MILHLIGYFLLLLLTVAAPYWSVLGLILVSPWNVLNELIGWDPRLGWSLMLACYAAVNAWKHQVCRIPKAAIIGLVCFSLIALAGLQFGNRELTNDDLDSAKSILLYFVSGTCAAFSIIQLTDSTKRLKGVLIAACCSLLFALSFGLLQAVASYASGVASDRIPGTLGNPNYFAAYLALGATCATVFWRVPVISRKLLIAVALLASVTCILTLSRMGTVACFIGVSAALAIRLSGKLVNWKLVGTLGMAASFAVILALGYLAEVRRSVTYSDNPVHTQRATLVQGAEDLTRFEAARFSAQTWVNNPIFGVGLNTIAARNHIANGLYVTSHDTYLQVLAGTGTVGALMLIISIAACIRALPLERRRLLVPAVLQFALCGFFGDYLQCIEIFVLFSILFVFARDVELDQQAW